MTGTKPAITLGKTYELDIEDVRSVPKCTDISKQTNDSNPYSTPNQEPVYESPLCLGVETDHNTTKRRESNDSKGRRSKTNDIYERANDDTLPNCRNYTGYSYVTNTENVVPRLSQAYFAYDNPVCADEGERGHVYEESVRNSRFTENIVYDDTSLPRTLPREGIRDIGDTKSRRPSKNSYSNESTRKQHASCIQIFTLLLSVLACGIAILALLVASGRVHLSDERNYALSPSKVSSPNPEGNNTARKDENAMEQLTELRQKYKDLQMNYRNMEKQFASSKRNYTELVERNSELNNRFETVKNDVLGQLSQTKETMNTAHQKLKTVVQNINSTLITKLQNVDYDISSLSINVKVLRNISKQMGPRGFNGSQGPAGAQGLPGPQGKPGVGNLSVCIVGEETQQTQVQQDSANTAKVTVSHEQRPGWKVISVVCSTENGYGAIHNVLSRNNNKYTCTCAGVSSYGVFTPRTDRNGHNLMKCVLIYWECPVLT